MKNYLIVILIFLNWNFVFSQSENDYIKITSSEICGCLKRDLRDANNELIKKCFINSYKKYSTEFNELLIDKGFQNNLDSINKFNDQIRIKVIKNILSNCNDFLNKVIHRLEENEINSSELILNISDEICERFYQNYENATQMNIEEVSILFAYVCNKNNNEIIKKYDLTNEKDKRIFTSNIIKVLWEKCEIYREFRILELVQDNI